MTQSSNKKPNKPVPIKHAVFTFGRMNPPTVGHEKLINATIAHKADSPTTDHFVFISHSHDSHKNPLSVEDRIKPITKAAKGAKVFSSSSEMPSIIEIAKHLNNNLHYNRITMVAGDDRVDHYKKLLNRYNGSEYHFDHIHVVSAGKRDPNAKGVEGMSGTKMRQAAIAGKKDLFKSGIMSTASDRDKEAIYKKVRGAMGIHEDEKPIPYLLMTEKQRARFQKPAPLAETNSFVKKTLISFKSFLNLKESSIEDIPDSEVIRKSHEHANNLEWADIFDLYDSDEVVGDEKITDKEIEHAVGAGETHKVNEALDNMARIKRNITFMKHEAKRDIARKIALARPSDGDVLRHRALLAARRIMTDKLLAGRDKSTLSTMEKNALEARLHAMLSAQQSLAVRLIPKIKDIERKRLNGE